MTIWWTCPPPPPSWPPSSLSIMQLSLSQFVAQLAKNPPAMRETWVQSLGLEDLLEKRKATHSSILAWRIPQGWQRGQTRLSDFHFHFMYGCESWTIKKAECQRIGAFELWCWRRLLRVPGTARRSNQPRIFIGRTDAKAEALLWSPDAKNWLAEKDYFWERLRAGGEGGDREWNDWMASLTQFTWVWANSRRQWRTRKPGLLQSMDSQKAGHDLVTEQHFFQVWQSQFSLK